MGFRLSLGFAVLLAPVAHAVTECCPFDYRTYNGTGNNVANPSWGSAGSVRIRSKTSADYVDGRDSAPGNDRPSAREVLNKLFLTAPNLLDTYQANALFSAWAMVAAYDMAGASSNSSERLDMPCDQADYFWCSSANGSIAFSRSDHGYATTTSARAPINYATSYLDGSIVYGTDEATANSLRTFSKGKLNMTGDNLPHLKSDGKTWQMAADMSFSNSPHFFAMLVVLMREHNRRCDELLAMAEYSDYSDEAMFQAARMWVYSVMQHLTKNDFALKILGSTYQSFYAVSDTVPYNSSVDAGLDVFFATAAFRFAHSGVGNYLRLLDSTLQPMDGDGGLLSELDAAGLASLVQAKGIDPILLGGMLDTNPKIDASFSTSIAMSPLFTVPTFTVQRGRDHGLPTYNDAREAYGLARKASFSDITSDATVATILENLYGSIDKLDAYVGGICEDLATGAMVGELFQWSIADQLYRMQVGDRFWHQHTIALQAANHSTLALLIKRNTNITYDVTDAMAAISYAGAGSGNCSSTSSDVQNLAAKYQLSWVILLDEIDITVSAQDIGDSGMIGLGFGQDVMKDSDIIICEIFNSTAAECTDRHGVSGNKEPVKDTSGDLYLPVRNMSVVNGWTSVTYTRKLAGNDPSDYTITKGENKVIFAWASDGVGQHATGNSGTANINFYLGTSVVTTDTSTQSFFILHGGYMLAAWLVAVPAGWLAARYLKGRKVLGWQWYEVHAFLMGFAAQGVVALAVSGLTATKTTVSLTHTVLGSIVLVYTLLQLGSGMMRHTALTGKADNFGRFHTINRKVHKWSGRVLVIIAIVNCWYGLGMMSPSTTLSVSGGTATLFNVPVFGWIKELALPLYLPLLILAFVVLELHRHHQLGSIQDMTGWLQTSASMKDVGPPLVGYTLSQFHDRVTRGRKAWVIVEKKIINIQDFMNRHPGGRRLLLDHVGADVSKQFKGIGQSIILPTGLLDPHAHSATAKRLLKGLVVGRIVDTSEVEDEPEPEGLSKTSRGRDYASFKTKGSDYHRCKLLSRRRAGGDDTRPVWVYTFTWPGTLELTDETLALARRGLAFMNLHIASGREGAVVERPYNISEVCHVGAEEHVAVPWAGVVVRFHVRLYPDGEMSAVLRDITEGSIAMLQGPFNMPELKLNPPPHFKRLYLLAGGTGVNPMVSLVREYLITTTDEVLGVPLVDYAITLIWQVSSPKDAYDVERLQALNKQSGGRFTYLIMTGNGEVKLGASVQAAAEGAGHGNAAHRGGWRGLLPWRRRRGSVQETGGVEREASELELMKLEESTRSNGVTVHHEPMPRGSQEPFMAGMEGTSDAPVNLPDPDPEAPLVTDVPMIIGKVTDELLSEVIGRAQMRRLVGNLRHRVFNAASSVGSIRSRAGSQDSVRSMERGSGFAIANLSQSVQSSVPGSPVALGRSPKSAVNEDEVVLVPLSDTAGAGSADAGGFFPLQETGSVRSELMSPRPPGAEPDPPKAHEGMLHRVAAALAGATHHAHAAMPPRMLALLNLPGSPARGTVAHAEGAAVNQDELRIVVSGPSGFTQSMQRTLSGMSIPSHVVVLLD